MSVEANIFTRLSNFAGLTALVGSGNNCRVYPIHAKQGDALPLVVFQRVSTAYHSAMGADIADTDARFQFDCFDTTYDGARAVMEQVRAALQRYQAGGIVDAFVLNQNDFYEDAPELYRCQIDFKIHY